MASKKCSNCVYFEYRNGEYYCTNKDSSNVSPSSSCWNFESIYGYDEKEKRNDEKRRDYDEKHG